MAQPKLQAEFFVDKHGTIFIKEKPIPHNLRRMIYERDGGMCMLCKVRVTKAGEFKYGVYSSNYLPPAHVDHIIPRSRGGRNDVSNLRLLCESCNESKGAKLS